MVIAEIGIGCRVVGVGNVVRIIIFGEFEVNGTGGVEVGKNATGLVD